MTDAGTVERCSCAYAACPKDAAVKILTKTGWANVCKDHYGAYHLAASKAYTAERGLKVVGDMRHWIKDRDVGKGKMHGAFKEAFEANKPMRLRERVPGEDDEPLEVEHA